MLGTGNTLMSKKDVLKSFGIEERVSNYCHTINIKLSLCMVPLWCLTGVSDSAWKVKEGFSGEMMTV